MTNRLVSGLKRQEQQKTNDYNTPGISNALSCEITPFRLLMYIEIYADIFVVIQNIRIDLRKTVPVSIS